MSKYDDVWGDRGRSCDSRLLLEPLSVSESVELAGLLKALADPVRLRIVSIIASHAGGEACVCDITGVFELTAPTISHHLKVLRKAGVITGRRRGTWIYYRVNQVVVARASTALSPAADTLSVPTSSTVGARG